MCTYLKEDGILFSCDFFGSHLATSSLYASGDERYPEAVRRYFAEIMMPLRSFIQKDLEKLKGRDFRLIAPSHGPVIDKPAEILEAYRHWAVDPPGNVVVIPYVTMHGSTRKMVEHLVNALADKGITAYQFDLAVTDKDKLAMALVDAATLVIGTPTVLTYPHPQVSYAASLINIMRPKVKYVSVIGAYGWGGKAVEYLRSIMPGLDVEYLDSVLCQGSPKEKDLLALDNLAATIAEKHKSLAG
jgi:flavorubredoxin